MRDPGRDPERLDERARHDVIAEPPTESLDPDPARDAVERLQRTAGNSAVSKAVAPESRGAVRRVAESLVPGLGRPLEPPVRREMEAYLGRDLGGVRVHADAAAGRVARGLGARAFAAGSHVVFAEGAFAPLTASGRALLAHELTHVIQQRGAPGARGSGTGVATPQAAEDDARRSGRAAAAGARASGAAREAPAAVLQGDLEEATRLEWEKLGDLFESDEEAPGPVVLAEGLAATSTRLKDALESAGSLTEDAGEQGRMRRVGEDLERAEKEVPQMVADVDVKRLPDIRDALEDMCEGLDKVEQIPDPAEQRPRAVQELTRVTKAAGKLEAALPNGTWRTRMKALADLGPLVARLVEAPVAADGGDGDGEESKPEAES
jgi:hypothetical protein